VLRLFGRTAPKPISTESPFWSAVARIVMRRALPLGAVAVAVLLVLGGPFLSIRFGSPDDRVLPASASSRTVGDVLRSDYRSNAGAAMTIVIPDDSVDPAALGVYSAAIAKVPGVDSVTAGPVR